MYFQLGFEDGRVVTAKSLVESISPVSLKLLDRIGRFFRFEESKTHDNSPHGCKSLLHLSLFLLDDVPAYIKTVIGHFIDNLS